MFDVIAIGELLIDFTSITKDEENYPTLAAHAGGAPANFLAALAKYNRKTAFIGKVGDDAFGHLLKGTLEKNNICTDHLIIDSNYFTTLAFVTLDDTGNRFFSFARKPGADTQIRFEEIDLSLLDQTKVVHFGTLSLTDEPAKSCTKSLILKAKEKGKIISFDPNLRKPLWFDLNEAKSQILWGLEVSDIVKISDEEVEFLFDLDPIKGAEYLMEHYNIKLLYVTCGAKGAYFKTQKAAGFVSTLEGIDVVDTTGAGDIFGGLAMMKLLEKEKEIEELSEEDLKDVVRFACTGASLSTTKYGGLNSVPSYDEVTSYLK